MSFIEIVILSFGLASDAFSVSITNGMTIHKIRHTAALSIAIFFGVFQGVMPLMGFYLGTTFMGQLDMLSKPVAFVILFALGGKMLFEALKPDNHVEAVEFGLDFKSLIFLSIATSIDAAAVGVTFATLNLCMPVYWVCGIIAGITFLTCLFGVYFGKKFGSFLGDKCEVAGGLILILISIKILLF